MGLTGVRFTYSLAEQGKLPPIEFKTDFPAKVIVGYFTCNSDKYAQPPRAETNQLVAERNMVDTQIWNAIKIDGLPSVNIHLIDYPAGKHKLELFDNGLFLFLGVVVKDISIKTRSEGF